MTPGTLATVPLAFQDLHATECRVLFYEVPIFPQALVTCHALHTEQLAMQQVGRQVFPFICEALGSLQQHYTYMHYVLSAAFLSNTERLLGLSVTRPKMYPLTHYGCKSLP